MGIKDLLRQFEAYATPVALSTFRGKRIAIDASSFLHKAVYATAEDRIDAPPDPAVSSGGAALGADYQLYVDVILHRVLQLLDHCGVRKVVMVFDGPRNAMKHETQQKREAQRAQQMQQAYTLLQQLRGSRGSTQSIVSMRQQCVQCLQRGLGVEREMEMHCIAALLQLQLESSLQGALEVIVAPMEADPQLAYLCVVGECDAVLSDDSDLLVYSAASGCSFPIITKYDSKTYTAQVIDFSLALQSEPRILPQKLRGKLDFVQQLRSQLTLSFDTVPATAGGSSGRTAVQGKNRIFCQLCILAGCDYSDSIPSVGLLTALQAVIRFKDIADDTLRMKKICDFFTLSGKKVVPPKYLLRVRQAEVLFYHHLVYDPLIQRIVHYTDAQHAPAAVLTELQLADPSVEKLVQRWDCQFKTSQEQFADSSSSSSTRLPLASEIFTGRWWLLKKTAMVGGTNQLVAVSPSFPWQKQVGSLPVRAAETKKCSAWALRARLKGKYSSANPPTFRRQQRIPMQQPLRHCGKSLHRPSMQLHRLVNHHQRDSVGTNVIRSKFFSSHVEKRSSSVSSTATSVCTTSSSSDIPSSTAEDEVMTIRSICSSQITDDSCSTDKQGSAVDVKLKSGVDVKEDETLNVYEDCVELEPVAAEFIEQNSASVASHPLQRRENQNLDRETLCSGFEYDVTDCIAKENIFPRFAGTSEQHRTPHRAAQQGKRRMQRDVRNSDPPPAATKKRRLSAAATGSLLITSYFRTAAP